MKIRIRILYRYEEKFQVKLQHAVFRWMSYANKQWVGNGKDIGGFWEVLSVLGCQEAGIKTYDFVGKFLRQIITENIKDALPKFTTLKVYKKGSLPERPLIIIKT